MANPNVTAEAMAERRTMAPMIRGSMAEGIAGVGAIVITILGLSQVFPDILLGVATIAVGSALMFEGGAIAARFANLVRSAAESEDVGRLGLGVTSEFLGGVIGIVLGVLALLGIYPLVLIPAAVIAFGSTVLVGSSVNSRLNSLWVEATEQRQMIRDMASSAISAAAGVQVLIGITAITLGILALTGIRPMILSLVALLGLGFADLMSGTTLIGRFRTLRPAREER
ncbi:MAG: hypothetical protein P8Y66_11425 [Nitrospirota bacterium]